MSSPVDHEQLPQEVKDGFVAAVLGGLAMTARLLLSNNPVSVGWAVRRIFAASITALFVGFFLQDEVQSVALRYALIGACAYSAPEAADCVARWIRERMNQDMAARESKPKRLKKRKPGKNT